MEKKTPCCSLRPLHGTGNVLCCAHGAVFVGEPEPFSAEPQSTPFALGPGS